MRNILYTAAAFSLLAGCQSWGTTQTGEEDIVAPDTVLVEEADVSRWANVTIGIDKTGALAYTMECSGVQRSQTAQSQCSLNTGDLDLAYMGPGDVPITISLSPEAQSAGYSFLTETYQSIGIAVMPPGVTQPPPPSFGREYWPTGSFGIPQFAGPTKITFIDYDEDQNAYEYSVKVNGPNGPVVLDPRIKNGGRNR